MKKTILTSSLALTSLFFVSCAGTSNPLGNQSANVQQKTAIGAAAGAAAGLLSGDDATERRQKATVGAALGAGAGFLYGKNQDVQQPVPTSTGY